MSDHLAGHVLMVEDSIDVAQAINTHLLRLGHMVDRAPDGAKAAVMAAETTALAQCAETEDFKTGIDAFFAKQPAQFMGR